MTTGDGLPEVTARLVARLYYTPIAPGSHIYTCVELPVDKPADHDPDFLAMDPLPPESEEAESMGLGYPLTEVEIERLIGQIRGSLPEDWQ